MDAAVPVAVVLEESQSSMCPMAGLVKMVFLRSLKVHTRLAVPVDVSMDHSDAMGLPVNCVTDCHTFDFLRATMQSNVQTSSS